MDPEIPTLLDRAVLLVLKRLVRKRTRAAVMEAGYGWHPVRELLRHLPDCWHVALFRSR